MHIALTKKLADAVELNLSSEHEDENLIFSWTANWTNVWDNRRTEDMLVLVNNATRFTVAIYEVKRKDLKKNVEEMISKAITNTLLSMDINPELVTEYMRLAGEMKFTRNRNRQAASWVSSAGLECAFYIGKKHNVTKKMFSDTVGAFANYRIFNVSGNANEAYYPYKAMIAALSELTGKQAYRYRAFELLITLDLTIYKAVRRIIVPANLEFVRLHNILQSVFDWKNYHLYDFTILGDNTSKPLARLVPFEEDLEYDADAQLLRGRMLSEFLPEHNNIRYTYDLGDSWEHEIELVRVIEAHDEESPYLLEASGQTPPEDVGGVGGFVNFYEIMHNTSHPEYPETKRWSGYWTTELREWSQRPRVIRS